MDEEVKRRRKEKEQQAEEQRQAAERMRKMEEDKLLALWKPALTPNQIHKLNQNPLQRTQTALAQQLARMPTQSQVTLQLPQNLPPLPLQSQAQQRTHGWPNGSTTTSQGRLPSMASLTNNYPPFFTQRFHPSFPLQQNSSLHQTTPSPNLSSKNPLEEILDLTTSSPSPSPDSVEGRPNLDSLTGNTTAFGDDFNLESLISPNAQSTQHTAQIQQPLLLQQQLLQQQLNHSLLATTPADLSEFFDLALSPQMPTEKASPSSSSSSCSSSTLSVSNNLASQVSAGLLSSSAITPTSSSSSLFSSPSSSLFPSSQFPSTYLTPPSDTLPLHNGHCNSGLLDVREALNSMLQAGPDRKSVIQYRQQD